MSLLFSWQMNPACIFQEEGPLPSKTTPNHSKNDRFPSSERVKQMKKVNFSLFIFGHILNIHLILFEKKSKFGTF